MNNYEEIKKLFFAKNSLLNFYDDLMKQQQSLYKSLYLTSPLEDQFKSSSASYLASQNKDLYSSYDLIKNQRAAIFGELSLAQKGFQAAKVQKSFVESFFLPDSIKSLMVNSFSSDAMRIGAASSFGLDRLVETNLILSSSLKSLLEEHKLLERSYFPRIDITSVLALNNLRVYEDFRTQLDKLSLQYENVAVEDFKKNHNNQSINFDLWTHIYFLISILLFFYQMNDSQMMEKRINNKIDKNATEVQKQIKYVEKLLENIISTNKNSRVGGIEYIVKSRNTKVRSLPKSGSKVIAEIYPNQVVKPLKAEGKWVEVEYYDWLQMKSTTGWVLKKYLKRIQPSISRAAKDNPDLPIDFVRDLLIAKAQCENELTPFEPENLN